MDNVTVFVLSYSVFLLAAFLPWIFLLLKNGYKNFCRRYLNSAVLSSLVSSLVSAIVIWKVSGGEEKLNFEQFWGYAQSVLFIVWVANIFLIAFINRYLRWKVLKKLSKQ